MLTELVEESSTPSRKKFTGVRVAIGPREHRSISLGSYPNSEPQPLFKYIIEPSAEKDLIGVSIERTDIPGKSRYVMFCQLHNYGTKECRVTVQAGKATN